MDISIYHAQPTSTTSSGMCLFIFTTFYIASPSYLVEQVTLHESMPQKQFPFFGLQPIYIRKKLLYKHKYRKKEEVVQPIVYITTAYHP